ncbi:GGDEF domain-containing protein [Neptuniibacter caesariensis]|uniref:diguanylate cyclase n=1 Tax=Neptuniibacter caesariensis TaxID=207954 RepID=A0A7U8C2L0_NEPCE|nr:GGDEF domain-containing protein [Neptuniibacter caesariensis]EAR60330.1 GGDEF domain protein [Neptuniibacter caesariensis]
MNPRKLSSSLDFFLRRFCAIAILSSVLVLVLSGYAASLIYERYVVRLAESNAVNLASSIINAHRTELDAALIKAPLLPPDIMSLDRTLRAFIQPYGIVKIKMFSPKGIVIYSTDMRIIGTDASQNAELQVALNGGASSLIQHKDQFRDLTHEERFDVDVVESYVAMKNPEGKVIGAFEIYQDMSGFRGEVQQGVALFVGGLALIVLGIITTAFAFMRKAAKRLISQQYQLETLATVDSVTGLYNRAEITRRMEAEWQRFKRGGPDARKFALLMLDLDHFKRINDNYGHLAGDELLRRVAGRLREELRSYSEIGRYGGEEFIVLIPEITNCDAYSVAERLRVRLVEPGFDLGDETVSITTSIGFAIADDSDKDLDALIKRADDCLYEAKGAGRNRVVGAVETAPEL